MTGRNRRFVAFALGLAMLLLTGQRHTAPRLAPRVQQNRRSRGIVRVSSASSNCVGCRRPSNLASHLTATAAGRPQIRLAASYLRIADQWQKLESLQVRGRLLNIVDCAKYGASSLSHIASSCMASSSAPLAHTPRTYAHPSVSTSGHVYAIKRSLPFRQHARPSDGALEPGLNPGWRSDMSCHQVMVRPSSQVARKSNKVGPSSSGSSFLNVNARYARLDLVRKHQSLALALANSLR